MLYKTTTMNFSFIKKLNVRYLHKYQISRKMAKYVTPYFCSRFMKKSFTKIHDPTIITSPYKTTTVNFSFIKKLNVRYLHKYPVSRKMAKHVSVYFCCRFTGKNLYENTRSILCNVCSLVQTQLNSRARLLS